MVFDSRAYVHEADKAALNALKAIPGFKQLVKAFMKVTDLAPINVKDGAIEDAENVKAAIQDEWGAFIAHTSTHGAKVENPPANAGGAKMTKDEIMAIKDTSARQKAIAENIEQFR